MGEVILTLAVLAGILAGAGMMRRYQSKCRMEELQRISRLADEILEGRKLSAALSGEDTFPAKIEHQMVRLQEVLEGKSREAEKSRKRDPEADFGDGPPRCARPLPIWRHTRSC